MKNKLTAWNYIDGKLVNCLTNEEIILQPNSKYSLSTPVVKKNVVSTILNSAVNAFTNSIANGDERANVVIIIEHENQKEEIQLNSQPLVRYSLDYHALIREGRHLIKRIKNHNKS